MKKLLFLLFVVLFLGACAPSELELAQAEAARVSAEAEMVRAESARIEAQAVQMEQERLASELEFQIAHQPVQDEMTWYELKTSRGEVINARIATLSETDILLFAGGITFLVFLFLKNNAKKRTQFLPNLPSSYRELPHSNRVGLPIPKDIRDVVYDYNEWERV